MFKIKEMELRVVNQRYSIYAEGDYLPFIGERVYEKRDTLYREVTNSSVVDFFSLGKHASMTDQAIAMSDGTIDVVNGYRWSSRPSVLNKYFPECEHLIDVHMNSHWVYVRISVIQEALDRLHPGFKLSVCTPRYLDKGEIAYEVVSPIPCCVVHPDLIFEKGSYCPECERDHHELTKVDMGSFCYDHSVWYDPSIGCPKCLAYVHVKVCKRWTKLERKLWHLTEQLGNMSDAAFEMQNDYGVTEGKQYNRAERAFAKLDHKVRALELRMYGKRAKRVSVQFDELRTGVVLCNLMSCSLCENKNCEIPF